MNGDNQGIWVRAWLDDGSQVMGFAIGAESPNDFWSKFRTQLVRLEEARITRADGEAKEQGALYLNRDRIVMVKVADEAS